MRRRQFLVAGSTAAALMMSTNVVPTAPITVNGASEFLDGNKLTPPAEGQITVAFTISRGATMIDFAGPWEVFQDVMLGSGNNMRSAFRLYTVSEKTDPIESSGGMKIIPDYTFEAAPPPRVVVIPAQDGSPALHAWLRKIVDSNDVTMSVCNDALLFGRAGLLTWVEEIIH